MKNKKFLILLLEDSKYQADQINESLSGQDRLIITSDSIRSAKRIFQLKGKTIDLLILDLKLPDGNGLDFLRFVRKLHFTTPAIITSAFISDNVQKEGDELSVTSYFEKPLTMDDFENTVNEVLHNN